MRRAPASTEDQKMTFLLSYEWPIRRAKPRKLGPLLVSVAQKMREAGLYSPKTITVDIVNGLRKRSIAYGWIEREKFIKKVPA